MNNVIVGDVSFYQYGYKDPANGDWTITRYVDFKKMRTQTPAVIIRAGQQLWKDRTFDISWSAAWLAGLARGSYFFYDSRAEPKKQAQLWIQTLNGDLGELPLFLDLEENYGGAWAGWKHWYTFLEELKRLAPGKEIIIYTNYYFWLENTTHKNIPAASLEYFKQYDLWIANYGVATPLVPKPWDTWTFWQFTAHGDGALYGVESKNIDLNYFNGDIAAFNARFELSGNVPQIPIPPTGAKMSYEMTTIYSGTRIREDHNTFAKVLSSVNANIVVSGDELWTAPAGGAEVYAGDQWLHVTYGLVTGWMALKHKGEAICKDLKVIGTPVPPLPPSTETYIATIEDKSTGEVWSGVLSKQ